MELIPYGIICLIGIYCIYRNERRRIEMQTLETVSQALYARPTQTINCLAPGLLTNTKN